LPYIFHAFYVPTDTPCTAPALKKYGRQHRRGICELILGSFGFKTRELIPIGGQVQRRRGLKEIEKEQGQEVKVLRHEGFRDKEIF
jgi:hypothetical protein